LDLADADLLVDARPLLGGGLRRSDRATNGCYLLVLLLRRRSVPRLVAWAKRRTLKIGSFSIQVNADADRHGRSGDYDLFSATAMFGYGLLILYGR